MAHGRPDRYRRALQSVTGASAEKDTPRELAEMMNTMRIDTVQLPPDVAAVLVEQIKACRRWIEKNAPHGRAWQTCICENCIEIRVLMGTHCCCEPRLIVPASLPVQLMCQACGLALHPL